MGQTTEISWAHSTFNPVIGCTKISPGCDNCYAAALDKRWGHERWGVGAPRERTSESYWRQPLKWDRLARESGEPWRVFCGSMCDVFDNDWPEGIRTDLWALIAATPNLTWMLLTKRIGNVTYPMPANVWLGITVVNQEEADRDIRKLLLVDAPIRWLSCEPLLGPINLRPWLGGETDGYLRGVDWVIVGGESGRGARPMDPLWAYNIRDQCRDTGTAFHFKQWGEFGEDGRRLGKKAAGHMIACEVLRAFPGNTYSPGGIG